MSLNFAIISTGNEFIHGRSFDTNSGWIANELLGQGFKVYQILVLPDNPIIIQTELEALAIKNNIDWIIMTGGLGPTADDYTVDAVLNLTSTKPNYVEKAQLKLQSIYKSRGINYENMRDLVTRQTRVPQGSKVLDNRVGVAPGFIVELLNQTKLACLPGVPSEMKVMFSKKLLPKLLEYYGKNILHRVERSLWNIGESIYQKDFINSNPFIDKSIEWGVTSKKGYINVSFISQNEDKLNTILSQLENKYFPNISLDVHVELHNLLIKSNCTIAIAESCTGGLIGKLLTDQPDSSSYFVASLVAYHNQAKEKLLNVSQETLRNEGAVSAKACEEMVIGLEKQFNTDYSLSVTGIAGPKGGSEDKPVGTIFIGIKKKDNAPRIQKYNLNGTRETIRESTANISIFQLYKEVMQK